jgi:hypothetical protein
MEVTLRSTQVVKYVQDNDIDVESFLARYMEVDAYVRSMGQKSVDTAAILSAIGGDERDAPEAPLYGRLLEMFPSYQIDQTDVDDFRIHKGHKGIVVGNKNCENNVKPEDIAKFEADVASNKMNGVMISEKSGIVGKDEFHVDIKDGNVLIYLSRCNDNALIRYAVETVCVIEQLLEEEDEEDVVVDPRLYLALKQEYEQGAKIKETVMKQLAQSQQQLSKLNLSNLGYLVGKYVHNQKVREAELCLDVGSGTASVSVESFKCELCSKTCKSQGGLQRHVNRLHNDPSDT